MRALLPALVAVVFLIGGCGGSDDESATTVSSGEVESSLRANLSASGGGGGGGVVDLGTGPPKLVRCVKDSGRKNGWRCTVKPTTGKNVLCLVEVDPQTKKARKTTCTRIDN